MTREAALEDLYKGLATMVRRSRGVGDDLHPRLSLVAYTLLTEIYLTPGVRAADLCAHFGLDKSTRPGCCAVRESGRGAGATRSLLPPPASSTWPPRRRPSEVAWPNG